MLIPRGLLAADPSSMAAEEVDVLIVGSGVAGLSGPLAVPAGRAGVRGPEGPPGARAVLPVGAGVPGLSPALAMPAGRSVMLATKDRLGHSATRYAQGGIAAVLDLVSDSVAEHVADTLAAGAGLCDPVAVGMLAAEGAKAIEDLLARGGRLDRDGRAGVRAPTRAGRCAP